MEMLHLAELGDVLFQQALVLLLGFVDGVDFRRPLREIDLVALADAEILRFDFHDVPFGGCRGDRLSKSHSAARGV